MQSRIDECISLLRLRWCHQRKPKFLYVADDVYYQLHRECLESSYVPLTDMRLEAHNFLLFGLHLIPFDLPPGFILASETELH